VSKPDQIQQAGPATYPTFAAAAAACGDGYADPELAQVVLQKTLIVMSKPWPDLQWTQGAGLYIAIPYVAARVTGRPLRVLDFGGAFGAHGMICARVMRDIPLRWAVVESPAFAEIAKPVESNALKIFSRTGSAVDWLGGEDLLHSSGTLQYLAEPEQVARELTSISAPFMLWQRMAFAKAERLIVVQTSRLAENGMGPLPPAFKDRQITYPATYVTEAEFMQSVAGYSVVVRIPGSDATSDGLATFGTVLLLGRS
jgi:putative methyltransferase (TIGR04325 family)